MPHNTRLEDKIAESVLATALGLRGSNPEKLDLINLDPTKIQAETIAGNLAAAPGAFQLADLANTFSTEQLLKSLEMMLPGFGAMRDSITGAIKSKIAGELTEQERRFLDLDLAESGIAMGTSGSGFDANRGVYGRLLSRHNIQNEGISQGAQWIRSMPQAPKMDFTSMFFTPQQRLNFEFQQAQANKPIEWLNNQIDALPSNIERAAAGFLDWAATTGTSIMNMGIGNIMGGGGAPAGGGGGGGGGTGGGGTGMLQSPTFSMGGGAPDGGSFANYYGSGVSPYSQR